MLDADVPLLEGVSTIAGGRVTRAPGSRAVLLDLRESLRSGSSLADAMDALPAWFDVAETAMVASGQHTGELAPVLRTLAERHERSGELSNKLAAALAYPAIVALVGLGVVVFLSKKTLPDLVAILDSAGIGTPALTSGVMWLGGALLAYGPVTMVAVVCVAVAGLAGGAKLRVRGIPQSAWTRRLTPRVVRQAAVAEISLALAEMARTGVPIVESLRVLAPTIGGFGRGRLRTLLLAAADRVERGETLSGSLDDELWFDAELRRLIEIGESSGELADVLQRVGERQHRAARRAIDRVAAMLEPCVILVLAALVGLVVLAAILPLIRLQEVLG